MCGIFGFSGPRAVDEAKLRLLAVENQPRGTDSTGVYGNHIYKDNSVAKSFIQQRGFRPAIQGAKAVGGHTRAGSLGSAKTAANSHPFLFNAKEKWCVVGAHNGFIIPEMLDHHTKELGFDKKAFDVDSQLIFASIAKYEDVNIISKIEGAMALWFCLPNQDKDTIYLYRRAETRELHIGSCNDGLYFSSEDTPLYMIGASKVFEVTPNFLFTLRRGEIIDQYPIALPILKSLAAKVTRADWQRGIPLAELDALPDGVISQAMNAGSKYATGGSTKSGNYSRTFENELEYSYPKKAQKVQFNGDGEVVGTSIVKDMAKRKTLIDTFPDDKKSEWTNDVLAKWFMLIKGIKEQIATMQAEVIKPSLESVVPSENYMGCLLMIKLLNADTDRALAGWSVVGEGSIEFNGITIMNGITAIKIPVSECGKLQVFHAYDPIDSFGPYSFQVKPTKSSVMEVTLKIPFRKKNDKEEARDKMHVHNGCSTYESRHPYDYGDSNRADELYGPSTELPKQDTRVLHGKEEQNVKRLEELKTDGQTSDTDSSSELVPDTEVGVKEIKYGAMVPNFGKKGKIAIIHFITQTDEMGVYVNLAMYPKHIVDHANKEPRRNFYTKLYSNRFTLDEINYKKLINDATQIMIYDRRNTKAWYKLGLYINMLLLYSGEKYVNKNQLFYTSTLEAIVPEKYLASSVLKESPASLVKWALIGTNIPYPIDKAVESYQPPSFWKGINEIKTPSFVRNIPFNHFEMIMKWYYDNRAINFMAKEELTGFNTTLGEVESTLGNILKEIRESLNDNEDETTSASISMRAALQKARNFLAQEQEDVHTLRNQVISRLKSLDEAEKRMATESCCDCD